jgi:glucosamine--fructose-6-phosphate aminotransferase (isomerizing)
METGQETYPHHMLREIHEQPEAIRQTLKMEGERISEAARILRERQPRFVILAARGTSDNAGTYLRYIVGVINGMVVAPAAPSLLTAYHSQMQIEDAVVIGISQSGEATDVIEVLETSRELGATTMAVTNTADSPIVDAVEFPLLTHAQTEKAVAATKTYTTALAVLHQLSACWAERKDLQDELQQVPGVIDRVLSEVEPVIETRAERYTFMDTCTVLGRGLNYATAKEVGLKLQECCLINPEPWSAADYMHGPIAALQPGDPVLLLAPRDAALKSVLEVEREVRERQAETIVFSDDDQALEIAHLPVRLPDMQDTCWSPIVVAVAGQLFAYYVAVSKGLNPDEAGGLRKVTLTY